MKETTTTKTTNIAGYDVELELFEENGEERSSCTITSCCGGYNSSLTYAETNGVLESMDGGQDIRISIFATQAIRRWAEERGY